MQGRDEKGKFQVIVTGRHWRLADIYEAIRPRLNKAERRLWRVACKAEPDYTQLGGMIASLQRLQSIQDLRLAVGLARESEKGATSREVTDVSREARLLAEALVGLQERLERSRYDAKAEAWAHLAERLETSPELEVRLREAMVRIKAPEVREVVISD